VPNPGSSRGALRLTFTLASDAPARLTAYDVRGRVVLAQAIERPAPGPGAIALHAKLPAGVLWLRLEQAGKLATVKAVVLP